MKRSQFIIILGIVIILFIIPITTYAETNESYKVSANVINVRSGPSSDASIVGKLTKGTPVKIFKEQYGWVQTYYEGQEVWIAKQYLIPSDGIPVEQSSHSSSSESSKVITIQSEGVNIRSGPGEEYSVVDSATFGDTYTFNQSDGEWHQITLPNGSKAWVASWLTDYNLSQTMREEYREVPSNSHSNGSLAGRHIVLDPGHGGHDPGAIGLQNTYEKNLTLSVAKSIVQSLRHAGANVTLTRDDDYYLPLEKRAQISNTYQTDAFLSLHFNAFPILTAQGISTYYYTGSGRDLAHHVQAALSENVTLHNRGIIHADFHVLRGTRAPAALVELGFITNPHDFHTVQTNDYNQQVAQSITEGLINYFN